MLDIVRRCIAHLGTALRLILFLPVGRRALHARFGELVVIASSCVAARAFVDFAGAGEQPWFNIWGLISAIAAWTVFGVLVAALRSGSQTTFGIIDVMTAVAAIGTWLITVTAVLALAPPYVQKAGGWSPEAVAWAGFAAAWVVFLWTLAATWRVARVATAGRRRRLGLGLVLTLVLSSYLLPSTPIFRGPLSDLSTFSLVGMATDWLRSPLEARTEAAGQTKGIDVESTYYRQFALLDAGTAALELSPEGRPAMYFLGFAGYAGQNVFRSELSQARDLFDQRFATQGRSLLLVNHRDTVEELPLASVTNLATVLERLGRRMDREKDILFLFLTSHGSERALSVSFPRFALNDLRADDLRTMLDRSGIVNRVIVISACHSGTFVPALEDANTLIMVAARADRTSFGCDDKREWTYFGDALFNRALRQTRSLLAAFDLAKATVAGWEKMENLPASEPQISVGDNIGAKLEAWERSLGVEETRRLE